MRKLLLFLFLIIIVFIFEIDVKSEDHTSLLERKDDFGYYIINENLSYDDLIKLFKDNSRVSLISVKPDIVGIDKYIRLERGNVESSLKEVSNKIVNILSLDENSIKYKTKGFNITSMKVFGKNSDIYDFIEGIQI